MASSEFAAAPSASSRMLDEAKHAVAGMEAAEWSALIARSMTAATRDTVVPKARAAGRAARAIVRAASRSVAAVRSEGLQGAVVGGARAANDSLTRAVGRARASYQSLRLYSGQRRTVAALRLVVTGVTALAVAGGMDAEGGLPDLDRTAGMGAHRNPFSHTLLLGLASELSIRTAVLLLRELYPRLPERHLLAWDVAMRFVDTTYEAGVAGVWLGLAPHLLKDAAPLAATTKPLVWLPAMSMPWHKTVYTVSGLASGAAGVAVAAEPAEE